MYLVACVLVVLAVGYFFFGWDEKVKKYLFNRMSLEKKFESIIKTDLSSEYARCKFYINNNYKHGYTQTEWQEYYQKQIDSTLDKNSQEFAEAAAPILNAIVLDKEGYYMRRGMEDMSKKLERLRIGENDHISLNYYIEPYKYTKHKQSQAIKEQYANMSPTEYSNPVCYEETSSTHSTKSGDSFHQRMQAQRDLRVAEREYRSAVVAHKKFQGTASETMYEMREKRAYAALLSAQAKYDNTK